jgi:acyl-coenzyme A synthetase/AMP-(fatty) acid ligase
LFGKTVVAETDKRTHGDAPVESCPPPTTFDFLQYRAHTDPKKLALATKTRRVTYLSFYQDAVRFSIALKDIGVSNGSLVLVIANSDIYLHWLLLIACENNGAVSVSWPNVKTLAYIEFLDEVDFLLTEDVHTFALAKGTCLHADAAWKHKIFSMNDCSSGYVAEGIIFPTETQRITHSSGTTGGQKPMALSRGAQEIKIRFLAENLRLCSEDSLLLTMPFSVNATYLCATHFLRLGLVIVSGPLVWALRNFSINYLEILPITLSELLKKIPTDFVRPKRLDIKVVGAPFNRELAEKGLRTVCTDIAGRYATNEVWPVAYQVGHDGIGTLVPGVQVKILDSLGVALADGSIGQIAVKSATMIRGYYKNDEATKRHFSEGYFLTGDLGRLLAPRKLQIVGRCDDVLNRGGMKIPPDVAEAELNGIAGVVDLAVTTIASDQLFDDLCVGVVKSKDADRFSIVQQIITRATSSGWLKVRIKFIDMLPKTENGKLSRKLLRQMFAE